MIIDNQIRHLPLNLSNSILPAINKKCSCGNTISKKDEMMYYLHPNGHLEFDGKRIWIYVVCSKCKNEISINKLI